MQITRVDHYNLMTAPESIDVLRDFYVAALGLVVGPRPAFSFPGHWLYAGDRPLVHIAGKAGAPPLTTGREGGGTGLLNHIALSCTGYDEALDRLKRAGIPYRERAVPDQAIRQIFITDPAGVLLELNFDYRPGGPQGA